MRTMYQGAKPFYQTKEVLDIRLDQRVILQDMKAYGKACNN